MEKILKTIYKDEVNTIDLINEENGRIFLKLHNRRNYWEGSGIEDVCEKSDISEQQKQNIYTATLNPPR